MANTVQFKNAATIERILPNIDDDMRRRNISLRQMCHVNENGEGDSFVGVKADTEGMTVYFPIGYELPEDDDTLRIDVHNLFGVLATFMKEDSHVESPNYSDPVSVDFPMHAYIQVIRNFLNTGHYYIETEAQYATATKGVPDWPRTFKDQMGLVQKNGSIIFVHEAFSKMGAIYVSFVREKPSKYPSITESISILTDKINHTNNDVERDLFQAMRHILTYKDSESENRRFFLRH